MKNEAVTPLIFAPWIF